MESFEEIFEPCRTKACLCGGRLKRLIASCKQSAVIFLGLSTSLTVLDPSHQQFWINPLTTSQTADQSPGLGSRHQVRWDIDSLRGGSLSLLTVREILVIFLASDLTLIGNVIMDAF